MYMYIYTYAYMYIYIYQKKIYIYIYICLFFSLRVLGSQVEGSVVWAVVGCRVSQSGAPSSGHLGLVCDAMVYYPEGPIRVPLWK